MLTVVAQGAAALPRGAASRLNRSGMARVEDYRLYEGAWI